MATRSHSRFTDEIYCTPAPTAPEIQVKTLDAVRDGIFSQDQYKDLEAGLIAAEEMKSKDLYEKYAPQFKDKNKQLIFNLLNKEQNYSPTEGKSLLITRWKPFVPYIEKNSELSTKVVFEHDGFSYASGSDSQIIEWYLNFANSDLFAYYGGPLLAQDELQVLECIELAALREYFVQATNTVGSRTVGSDAHSNKSVPTPSKLYSIFKIKWSFLSFILVLISNTERVIDLDTKHIYGNAFAKATEDQLQSAFKRVDPPQQVNLIAIEAPSYGEGRYTRDQIFYILTTCYTGFKAAQILANKTYSMRTGGRTAGERRSSRSGTNTLKTVIHTGWWGCGAYGNNRQMMLITQIFAAHWAEINKIIFHVQTNEHQKDIDEADAFVDKLLSHKNVDEIIDAIVNLNLEWEKSNNT
jgi:hypothetical protein